MLNYSKSLVKRNYWYIKCVLFFYFSTLKNDDIYISKIKISLRFAAANFFFNKRKTIEKNGVRGETLTFHHFRHDTMHLKKIARYMLFR
jgi:hypothetical protein